MILALEFIEAVPLMVTNSQRAPAIIGIGGLNIDYVLSESAWASLPMDARREISDVLYPGSERAIEEADFARLRRLIPAGSLTAQAGGSSFNAVRGIRALRADVALEFIGCQGEAGAPGVLSDAFRSFSIGNNYVSFIAGKEPGSCLAIQERGERHLLTTRGANDRSTCFLTTHRDELAQALRSTTIVHVTPLLDPAASAPMLDLMRSAKALNPEIVLSLDPGAHWTRAATRDRTVAALVELSDLLFVNAGEHTALRADGLLERSDAVVFVKSTHQISIFETSRSEAEVRIDNPQIPVEEIKDSVGAGDVFAGGVLAMLASAPNSYAEAARVGLAMARRKLLDPNPIHPTIFRDLW